MESLDELFETLTLDVEYESPKIPEFQGYAKNPRWWNWWGANWPVHPHSQRKCIKDTVYYNKEGQRHRLFGPAYVSKTFNVSAWYKNGKLHREDGPAYIHNLNMVWFKEGVLHRLDGPAVVEGAGPKQYWIDGARMSQKEFKKQIRSKKKRGLI